MKLHYFHGRSSLRDLVMVRDERRIELHIRPVGDGLWGLVVLSGPDQGRPDGQFRRGPWPTQVRAESVLRSIAGALMGDGYEPCPGHYVVWSIIAQRLSRTITVDDSSKSPGDVSQFEPLT